VHVRVVSESRGDPHGAGIASSFKKSSGVHPIEKVDRFISKGAYYLAPDQGGEKAYRLLADAMEKSGAWLWLKR
jgi:hypothetical protein